MTDDFLDFLFPRFCVICGKRLSTQEKHLCLSCYTHLPRTNYHLAEHSELEKNFWGWGKEMPIEKAVSFFMYNDANKEILIQLKYKRNPQIGTYMASQFAKEIKNDNSTFFDDIDIIVPIPLHWMRMIKRSYNQSYYVAKGISRETRIPICTKAVKRILNNKSQTLMQRNERQDNVKGIFRLVKPELLAGKHILIVDDVTTTGSTIMSCAKEIAKAQNTKVSILTLAMAGQTLIPSDDSDILPNVKITKEVLSKL